MNPQVEIVPSDAATEQTSLEQHGFTRRQFIAGSAATLAIAAAGGVSALEFPANAEALTEAEPLGGEWIRTTCSPNCTGACGINAWVQDGQVRLLKQAADYPYEHYNPRGCLKGLSINTILHGPDRLTKPLMKNEDGEQIETDWDTALDTAADKLREIAEKYGPDSIGVIYQVQGTGHIQKGALVRIANTFGWSIIGGYELNGDLPMFWPETFGCQSEELESYCWEDSKLTLVFGSNVMVTRMPDAHFLTYSQENGGKVIYFDPNYSASAEKANEWVRIAPTLMARLRWPWLRLSLMKISTTSISCKRIRTHRSSSISKRARRSLQKKCRVFLLRRACPISVRAMWQLIKRVARFRQRTPSSLTTTTMHSREATTCR